MFSNYIHWLLKFHQEQKSIKLPLAVYADFQSILEKTNTCENNPEISHITKINKHTAFDFSIFVTFTHHKSKKNRQSFYRGADYMVKYCEIVKNISKEITNTEHTKNVSIFLLNKLNQENMSMCVTGKFRVAAHSALNLRYSIPRKIPVILHNVSNHHFHFMISIRT